MTIKYKIYPFQDKEQTSHHANVAYEIVQTSRKSVQKDEPGNDIKFFRYKINF